LLTARTLLLLTRRQSSNAYMKKVQTVFEKNFDKFELYVRRNIVAVPAAVAAEVAQRQRAQQPTGAADGAGDGLDDPSLSKEEQQERRATAQIEALHARIRQLAEDNQRLRLERQALDAQAARFRDVAARVDFLEDAPHETVAPLQRAVEHISSLRESFEHMDVIQTQIEEDTRQFKRQKLATRASFRESRSTAEFLGVGDVSDDLCAVFSWPREPAQALHGSHGRHELQLGR
jgi:hypothetical protein